MLSATRLKYAGVHCASHCCLGAGAEHAKLLLELVSCLNILLDLFIFVRCGRVAVIGGLSLSAASEGGDMGAQPMS